MPDKQSSFPLSIIAMTVLALVIVLAINLDVHPARYSVASSSTTAASQPSSTAVIPPPTQVASAVNSPTPPASPASPNSATAAPSATQASSVAANEALASPTADLQAASTPLPVATVAYTQITASNVNTLRQGYQITLPGVADGLPRYLAAVGTSSGVKDLLFVNTKVGQLLAVAASDGSVVWASQPVSATTTPPFSNVVSATATVGGKAPPPAQTESNETPFTTSSPALDPSGQYVYSYALDGQVHKYAVGDGKEVIDASWPETITIHPDYEKVSSPLTIATAKNGISYLYAATASFDDLGPYHGHVTAINLSDGSQNIFNATCSKQPSYVTGLPTNCPYIQSAVWGRPGIVYDPDNDRIYFSIGNGNFTLPQGGHSWGDSIIALNPNGATDANGMPLDSYTAPNYQYMADNDKDMGSNSPVLLPAIPGSKYPHLAAQAGKDSIIRLINLDDMSGQGGPGNLGGEVVTATVDLGGAIIQAPTTWVNPADGSVWLFIVNYGTASGWQISTSAGIPTLTMRWEIGPGGTSAVVNNNVLFYASAHNLFALDPTTGHELWADNHIGSIHWEIPLIVGNTLYLSDEDAHLTAYGPGDTVVAFATPVVAADDTPNALYFDQTGHFVRGRFLTYWQAHGDVPVFGYPISDPMNEVSDVDGKSYMVQYFERAEFEYHPENEGTAAEVMLTPLGSLKYEQLYAANPPAQQPSTINPITFSQTGMTVGGAFGDYWQRYGGQATFGYPISNEFQEVSTADGKTYTVQYFEQAEFEYHPENTSPFDVQPPQLGRARYQQKYQGK
jgi:hypothetical protein